MHGPILILYILGKRFGAFKNNQGFYSQSSKSMLRFFVNHIQSFTQIYDKVGTFMKILAIIAEYNPFHNGHLYHLEQAKALSSCDYTICILSSNFIQRGEPSIISKWARGQAALQAGIDLVLELPVLYSMSSAEYFAFGSIKILDSLHSVDAVCFGSESGSLQELESFASFLSEENPLFKENLKKSLEQGFSYPKAREMAIMTSSTEKFSSESFKLSNNILGIEYLKALRKLNSKILPLTIPRISNQYNTQELSGTISSATSIRKNIDSPDIISTLPPFSHNLLTQEFSLGRGPVFSSSYAPMILANLRKMSSHEISQINYVSEGLDYRIKNAAENSGNYIELLQNISTKRYPQTRLQRILFSSLLGILGRDLIQAQNAGGPPYAKVLGFSKKGKEILGSIAKRSSIPVVTNLKSLEGYSNPLIQRMIEIEKTSSDLYVLGYKNTSFMKAGQEFSTKLLAP